MRAATGVVDVHSAEDAAQEALVRAWRHRASCARPDAPDAWVRSISRREALRLVDRPRPPVFAGDVEEAGGASAPPEPSAVDLRQAVSLLGELDRRLLLRFYWAGQSDREIARELDMPLGTVKIRLHRARMRLHDELGESFPRAD